MAEWSVSLSELRNVMDAIEPIKDGDLYARFRTRDGSVFFGDVTGLSVTVGDAGMWQMTIEAEEVAG